KGRTEAFRSGIAVSPDGKTVATVEIGDVLLWDAASGKRLRRLNHLARNQNMASYHSLTFSPDSKTLAAGLFGGQAQLWDVATGEPRQLLKGHRGRVEGVAFSPDGTRLATGSVDSTILIWDLTKPGG